MGIRLSETEVWAEIEAAHTGIYTTLRSDGSPVSLPIWFVVVEQRIYVQTPSRSKKVSRIRRDPRGSFLVERGEQWSELCAVMVPVATSEVADGDEFDSAAAAFDDKYRSFRPSSKATSQATKNAYSSMALLRLQPAGSPLSWDNSRIRLNSPPAEVDVNSIAG